MMLALNLGCRQWLTLGRPKSFALSRPCTDFFSSAALPPLYPEFRHFATIAADGAFTPSAPIISHLSSQARELI
jgi:hypothetical protein